MPQPAIAIPVCPVGTNTDARPRALQIALLIPLLAARIATWDAQPLSLALEAEGVPAGPINDLAAVFADPQVIARGMRIRPDGAVIDGVASPIVIDGERMVAATGAPPLP